MPRVRDPGEGLDVALLLPVRLLGVLGHLDVYVVDILKLLALVAIRAGGTYADFGVIKCCVGCPLGR